MEILISFYDNALVYYPNVFFAILFFVSILGMILVSVGITVLCKKIRRAIKEIKSNLKQKKMVGKKRRKISFSRMVGVLLIFFVQMVRVSLVGINAILGHIESQTEKIIERIRKEILID